MAGLQAIAQLGRRHSHSGYFSHAIKLCLCLTLLLPIISQADTLVATIKPLAQISQGVANGVMEVETLLPANQSPHSYTLKPSDIRRLKQADLTIWIGPEFERPLAKILRHTDSTQIQVQHIGEIQTATQFERPEPKGTSSADHRHDHHDLDPHVWLNPDFAATIARQIAVALIQIKPQAKPLIDTNLAGVLADIEQLKSDLNSQLEPVRQRHYLVQHDSYRHFTRYFGLTDASAISLSAQHVASARHLIALQQQIQQQQIECVFTEPQLNPKLIHKLTRNSSISAHSLDPLGINTRDDWTGYGQLLRNLAQGWSGCGQ